MDGKLRTHLYQFTFASLRRRTINPVLGWRGVLIALLALALGSAGRPLQAEAQDRNEKVSFFMRVSAPKETLCTGERVAYPARVFFRIAGQGDSNPIRGVKIEAYAQPASIGTFFNAKKAGIASGQTGMMFLDKLFDAEFQFTAAKKPGTGELIFQGFVDHRDRNSYVSPPPIPVKVVECRKFKISADIKLPPDATGDANFPLLRGHMKTTEVELDKDGQFTGSTNLEWLPAEAATCLGGVCSYIFVHAGYTSQVKLSGEVLEDGMLKLDLIFSPASIPSHDVAGGRRAPDSFLPVNLNELRVDLLSWGAFATVPAELEKVEGVDYSTGSIEITVSPVKP